MADPCRHQRRRVFDLRDVKEKPEGFDFHPAPGTPEEHDQTLRTDIETFAGVVRRAGRRPCWRGTRI